MLPTLEELMELPPDLTDSDLDERPSFKMSTYCGECWDAGFISGPLETTQAAIILRDGTLSSQLFVVECPVHGKTVPHIMTTYLKY